MCYEDLQESLEHNLLWGKHLFTLHTKNRTVAIAPELAATLSHRDLECIITYPSTEGSDFILLPVVFESISVCLKELEKRERSCDGGSIS